MKQKTIVVNEKKANAGKSGGKRGNSGLNGAGKLLAPETSTATKFLRAV